jgi:hypothetical protein
MEVISHNFKIKYKSQEIVVITNSDIKITTGLGSAISRDSRNMLKVGNDIFINNYEATALVFIYYQITYYLVIHYEYARPL